MSQQTIIDSITSVFANGFKFDLDDLTERVASKHPSISWLIPKTEFAGVVELCKSNGRNVRIAKVLDNHVVIQATR